jgi:osmoprotectant transport system substrate-binding protein
MPDGARARAWATARGRARSLVCVLALLLAGCHAGGGHPAPGDAAGGRPPIRIASFDFPESQILAEIYAQALEKRGLPVVRLLQLGSREIVEPALELDKVDLVPEYIGTLLDFLSRARVATASAPSTYAALRPLLAKRGLVALNYAPGQDANGFAITTQAAARRGLRRISDLGPIAGQLVLGGPPECPERPLCLVGLRDLYGLRFKQFKPMASRADIAVALVDGEIDVGLLGTTDGNLVSGRLVLLADDRRLQPAENLVPVARRTVVAAYGAQLVSLLNAISARLTILVLEQLNKQVDLDRRAPAAVAADWLAQQRLPG